MVAARYNTEANGILYPIPRCRSNNHYVQGSERRPGFFLRRRICKECRTYFTTAEAIVGLSAGRGRPRVKAREVVG